MRQKPLVVKRKQGCLGPPYTNDTLFESPIKEPLEIAKTMDMLDSFLIERINEMPKEL